MSVKTYFSLQYKNETGRVVEEKIDKEPVALRRAYELQNRGIEHIKISCVRDNGLAEIYTKSYYYNEG